jgi:type I restriction enzyme S subunit
VNGGIFNSQASKALPDEFISPLELEIFKGDILMSRASGSIDLIGSVARVEEQPTSRLLLSDKTFRLKLKTQLIDPDFFVTVMGSLIVRRQIHQMISGAEGLANNIAQSDIKELVLPFPDLDEQQRIMHSLHQEIKSINSLSNISIETLALLQERRSALISAAVTGKIDVRGCQPAASVAPNLGVACG